MEPADAPAVAAAFADPDLATWVEFPTGDALADATGLIEELAARWRDGLGASFGVFDDATEEFRALVVTMMPDDPAVAEVAYWVAPAARRQGVATRAVGLLSTWALRDIGAARLWLEIEPGNEASHALARRAGYRREGVLRSHCRDRRTGLRHDCVIYSLVPGEEAGKPS